MKLTPEQQLEKKARENIKRLVNRVSSEFAFKKWRDYHSYLNSIGKDKAFIDTQANVELNREQLDKLLQDYETEALKRIAVTPAAKSADTEENKSVNEQKIPVSNETINRPAASEPDKSSADNNYGLSKSTKEKITLFWFQKKGAAEILKGFLV